MEPILAYSAYWHAQTNTGRLFLKLENDVIVHVDLDSPSELAALCDMLARTPQMAYDAEKGLIATTWLRPGTR